MGEHPAHRELFLAPLQRDRDPPGVVAHCRGDLVEVHHGAAVDLPEALGRKLREQLPEAGADERFPSARDDARVLVGRLEVADLLDRDHPHRVADARAQVSQRLTRALRRVGRDQLSQLRDERGKMAADRGANRGG